MFSGLQALLRSPDAQAALLFGVTGSGKTLVYLHLIEQALAAGQGAILLVPEISLTPQMIEAFSAYFGDAVAVLHSGLPLSERYDEWKRIRAGSCARRRRHAQRRLCARAEPRPAHYRRGAGGHL